MSARGWDARQVKDFVIGAIKSNQAAWDVVPRLRRAIIAERFAGVVTGLDRDSIPTAYLETLWADMCKLAETLGMAESWGIGS